MEVIVYYTDTQEFIADLDDVPTAKVISLIRALRVCGSDMSMPQSRSLGGGLFELRARGKKEVRLFYCFHRDSAIILHGIIKKTSKIPRNEIEIAKSRMGKIAGL